MSIIARLKDSRIGKIWLKYSEKIILTVGIVLIAAVAFEAGYLHGQKDNQEPVTISKVACAPCPHSDAQESASSETPVAGSAKTNSSTDMDSKNCPYVASKNSNKYHLASCQFAQKIKPENRICFSSPDEAQKKGYQGAKCCIK